MITEEGLQDIVRKIRESYPAKRILVFGSQARGDTHQHSDLNLCVIAAQGEGQPLQEWPSKSWFYRGADLIDKIGSAEVAVAPYVFTEGEFEALRNSGHPLVGRILEEGRVLYEQ
ncbi:MAG: nucleotidyltransferase domain-containing protein [Spirochaetales bacterium]|nr:nucleotidyltransferase domain-containing protein [Spirochaetales bacterium]